jgi:hypothetical protein
LNQAALVAHWDGQISGVELGRRLQADTAQSSLRKGGFRRLAGR